jgi:hypothetical protein
MSEFSLHYLSMFSVSQKNSSKSRTKQTEKDQLETRKRIQRNEAQWCVVKPKLHYYFGTILQRKRLLAVARKIEALKLDRLAKRSRDCICCWFCENWIEIEPILPSFVTPTSQVNESEHQIDDAPGSQRQVEVSSGEVPCDWWDDGDFHYSDGTEDWGSDCWR